MADRLTDLLDRLVLPEDSSPVAEELGARARGSFTAGKFREYWKYTPVWDFLSGLEAVESVGPQLDGIDQPGISLQSVAADGLSVPGETGDRDSTDRFPLADLALLISGDLQILTVRQTPAEPIMLTARAGLNVPLLINVEPGVALNLVERSEVAGFCNQSLYLRIAEGASVDHASTALESAVSHWALTQVRQAAASSYRRQQYQRGGQKRRTETQILLCGRDASTSVTGAFVVDSGAHLDQQLVVEHRAPATTSRQKFHGIGAGKGTSIFNGRIHIHPQTPGSDASLSNRNLALHADAVINTKPELEIYTDDVKCAHGATVGQMSEDSLFYLCSRGLDPEQARRMLCRAFITECIEGALAEPAEATLLRGWSLETDRP